MSSTPTLNPEDTQRLLDMLPTATSLREIARAMGKRQDIVRLTAAPFVTFMRINGTLSPCPCGKPRFHPYGCASIRHVHPPVSPYLLARRAAVVEMLTAGARCVDIDHAFGMRKGGAKNYLRFLSPAQLAAREAVRPTTRRKPKDEEPAPARVLRFPDKAQRIPTDRLAA